MNSLDKRSVESLEEALGHRFADRALLETALTHSSHAFESSPPGDDNEQLEFLGDAVLQLIASQELYQRFPAYGEGELSRLRAHLVGARHLLHCARELDLGSYLRLGRSEEKTGGRHKGTLLSDALEAVLAALYLDGGIVPARDFVRKHILEPELRRLSAEKGEVHLEADHKSRLQQLLLAAGRPEPRYELAEAIGPDHRKSFTMRVLVMTPGNAVEFEASGSGSTKKAASQSAAAEALKRLAERGDV